MKWLTMYVFVCACMARGSFGVNFIVLVKTREIIIIIIIIILPL